MKLTKHKIAAALAFIIGILSVFAGTRVLFGISSPNYPVLQWLVIYNVVAGLLSIAVAVLIWQKHQLTVGFSLFVVTIHALVLVLLTTVFIEVAATDSRTAMIFRTVIWLIIILLNIKTSKNEI